MEQIHFTYSVNSSDKKRAKEVIKELKATDLQDTVATRAPEIARAYNFTLIVIFQCEITVFDSSNTAYCICKIADGFAEIYFDMHDRCNPPIVHIYKKQKADW